MHEADQDFPVDLPLLGHLGSTEKLTRTPRRLAVCKHCRVLFAGEINGLGHAKPAGVCPAV
ncbi:MAG: hypothetical protein E4G90_02420 [Gemmatimonadales bacterium]|jgi:hypothetical protein|nr:MAG: hypothetical protein E4G90_02420 [Gemmatimonadales bacterium]